MSIKIEIMPRTLHFKRPAGTSRGVYTTRELWYILLSNKENSSLCGIGECAPLHDLSMDYSSEYESILRQFADKFTQENFIDWGILRNYPSMLFGFETAVQHYQRQSLQLWDTPFAKGREGIPINGLVWMGSFEYMQEQIQDKIDQGFRLIKLKIGAIDFNEELALLQQIRSQFSKEVIEIRVDANGAFDSVEALDKLNRLSKYDIHSIEQPIAAHQWGRMKELAIQSPIPIALDEELIGVIALDAKKELLDTIAPQYIILKPSLHGGIAGCEEWIACAEERSIGWWVTSALESNIGLNAIAQWTATLKPTLAQGLGTGMLFTDNIEMPLDIQGDQLWFNPNKMTQIQL